MWCKSVKLNDRCSSLEASATADKKKKIVDDCPRLVSMNLSPCNSIDIGKEGLLCIALKKG